MTGGAEQLFDCGSDSTERVAHRGTGTVQQVGLLIHQGSELVKGRRRGAKRDCLRVQRLRSLINELQRRVQGRGGAAEKLSLEIKLALEHLLDQFGLVLQRSHEVARHPGWG